MERLTASPPSGQRAVAPVVNVNTASAAVLALVPGLDEGLAGQIVDARASLGPDERTTVAWLYARNLVDAEAFKQIAPLLATRGYQFHIQCVGYGLPSGRYCVIEAVVDLAGGEPQIVYLRNLTRLGMPFVLSEER
jgi:type II secretory pathway component PulK